MGASGGERGRSTSFEDLGREGWSPNHDPSVALVFFDIFNPIVAGERGDPQGSCPINLPMFRSLRAAPVVR